MSTSPTEQLLSQLHGISWTLLIPLLARAYAKTYLPQHTFHDDLALDVAQTLKLSPADVSSDTFPIRLCIARSILIDRRLRLLLQEHPKRDVFVLACGLDTLPFRHKETSFICADLPHVIEQRRQCLPSSPQHTLCALSIPEEVHKLRPYIHPTQPPIVLIEGLLPYFPEEKVTQTLRTLCELFPKGTDLLIDTYHPALLTFANMSATFRRRQTLFQYGLHQPADITKNLPSLQHLESFDIIELLPWYMKKRCIFPAWFARGRPLATLSQYRIV